MDDYSGGRSLNRKRAQAVSNGKAHVATRLSQAPAHIDYLDRVAII